MLQAGRYPYDLKRRIQLPKGASFQRRRGGSRSGAGTRRGPAELGAGASFQGERFAGTGPAVHHERPGTGRRGGGAGVRGRGGTAIPGVFTVSAEMLDREFVEPGGIHGKTPRLFASGSGGAGPPGPRPWDAAATGTAAAADAAFCCLIVQGLSLAPRGRPFPAAAAAGKPPAAEGRGAGGAGAVGAGKLICAFPLGHAHAVPARVFPGDGCVMAARAP